MSRGMRVLLLVFGCLVLGSLMLGSGALHADARTGSASETSKSQVSARGEATKSQTNAPSSGEEYWTNTVPHLLNVSAVSTNEAWAVGPANNLYHYTGGQWVRTYTEDGDTDYGDIQMLSPTSGWIAAKNSSYQYDGTTWHEQHAGLRCQIGEVCKVLLGISALSANDVWGYGVANVYYTMYHWDGTQWSIAGPVMSSGYTVFWDISMSTSNDGWVVGYDDGTDPPSPVAYHYTGSSWVEVSVPVTSGHLYGVYAPVPGEAWLVGSDEGPGGPRGVILHYLNGVWTTYYTPDGSIAHAIMMSGASSGWVATDSSILVWDGAAWNVDYVSDTSLNGLSAAGGRLWAVGNDFSTVSKTGTGSWVKVTGGPTSNTLQSISAVSSTNMWAVGDKGTVLHTGGATWQRVAVPQALASRDLTSVQMLSPTDGYIVGDRVIGHWDGTAWSVISDTVVGLTSVYMTSPGNGWAVGRGGVILRDVGGVWTSVYSPATRDLNGIAMDSVSHGWAVGGDYENHYTHPVLLEYTGGEWVDRTSTLPPGAAVWMSIWLAPGGADGWIVGSKCFGGAKSVMRLVGGSWVYDPTGDTAWNLYSVGPGETSDFWALGGGASHYVGGTWGMTYTQTGDFLHSFAIVGHYGWAVGDNGTLLRYTPDAATPSPTPVSSSTPTGSPTPTSTQAANCGPTVTAGPSPTPALEEQATGIHSALDDNTGQQENMVVDVELAQWMRQALAPNGTSDIKEASFLFQECYGGGMLDDLRSRLGDSIKWMGASSAKADQQGVSRNNAPPGSYWSNELSGQLIAGNRNMVSAAATARASEPWWVRILETGQSITRNGGETIQLTDACATKRYAILWAGKAMPGDTGVGAVFEDIRLMHDILADLWNLDYGDTVVVLFGDGQHAPDGSLLPADWHAQPATHSALATAIAVAGNSLGSNDEFLFYASDHGELGHTVRATPTSLPGNGGEMSDNFALEQGVLDGINQNPEDGQQISVGYQGNLDSDSAVAVKVNGVPLGYLPRSASSAQFGVPRSILGTSNEVTLQSLNSSEIVINSIDFSSGAVAPVLLDGSPTPTVQPTPCAIQFSDVPTGSTFYNYIRTLACRGIISGYGDGTFHPGDSVTRGQVTKFVVNAAGLSDPVPGGQETFEDVAPGSTFWLYIERLAGRGYINGYQCGVAPSGPCVPPGNRPYFLPGNNVTRGQLAKIVANSAGFDETPGGQLYQDVPATSAFYPYVERLALRGVISGYGCGTAQQWACVAPGDLPYFAPGTNVTRGQTAKIVANTFFPGVITPSRK